MRGTPRKKLTPEELARIARRREYNRQYREKNRIRLQDQRLADRPRRAYIEWCRLLRAYGITVDQYELMHKRQQGVCDICKKPERTRRLAVDHDHKTGRVRGLLCWWCNNKVLASRNTAEMFDRAARYLRSTFDGRTLAVTLDPSLPVEMVEVEIERPTRYLAGILERLESDHVVHDHGLVFLSAETWERLHGTADQKNFARDVRDPQPGAISE